MRSNFLRLIRNKRSVLFIGIILFLTVLDIGIHLIDDAIMFQETGNKYAPFFAAFLSATTRGHIAQKLLFWFLPIYVLLICSDNYITDVKTGYNNIMIGKIGKAKYIRGKLLESFIFPTIVMFMILLINYISCMIIFKGGTFTQGNSDFIGQWDWMTNMLAYPNLTYVMFMISTSLLTGFCGLVCTSCAMFFPDYKFAYPLAFAIWFYGIASGYSTVYLMQPFAEFGLEILIPICLVTVTITMIITFSAYYYKVKTDEI